jgi:translation initiation factor 2D
MAIDTAKIKVRQGMKGKAVNLIHVYQDFLWALGDKSNPPEIDSIEELEGVDSDHDSEMEDASRQMENSHIAEQSTFTNQQTENENVQAETKEEKPALSTKGTWACLAVMTVMNLDTNFLSFRLDIDQLLKNTFYQALAFKLTKTHPPELLPMSASMLYSTYMLPSRPFVNGQEVDVKKSSWKKMQKFLKDMEKAGICKLKDRKGESHIVSINWNHEELTSAKPYKTLESKSSANNEKQPESSKAMASAATKDAKGQIAVQLYYKPKKTTVPLFEKQKKDIKQAYNAQEVRDVLMAYVDEENLIDPSEKRFIRIDPLLCDAILKKDEYNSINRLQRDQTLQR